MTVAAYFGPQCPRCTTPLTEALLRTGNVTCPSCSGDFEATAFHPAPLQTPGRERIELAIAGPDEAAACANHARNAAVTSCRRCGVFICALCDMNIGSGSYCPSCFERVRTEGSLETAAKRYRDYAAMARMAVLCGLLLAFLMLIAPLGALGVHYSIKALRQRKEQGKSRAGVIVLLVLALLEVVTGIGIILWLIWTAMQ